MKGKIIITSFILIILLSACQKVGKQQVYKNDLEANNEIIENKIDEMGHETKPSENKEKNVDRSKKENKANNPKQSTTEKPKILIESTQEGNNSEINEIRDENSIDYKIHKGRIDCQDETTCMDISLPIQFKYKQSITNVYYLEVVSKSNNVLGYFIQYIFKDANYQTEEECHLIGEEITKDLSDRVIGYECHEDGILKINTDY